MSRLSLILISAALGAALVWVAQQVARGPASAPEGDSGAGSRLATTPLRGDDAGAPAASPAAAPSAASGSAARAQIVPNLAGGKGEAAPASLVSAAPAPAAPATTAGELPAPKPEISAPVKSHAAAAPIPETRPAPPPLVREATPLVASRIEEELRLHEGSSLQELSDAATKGNDALAAGKTQEGLRLLRLVFEAARERQDLQLTALVERLLEHAPPPAERAAYLLYLARRDTEPARIHQAGYEAGQLLLSLRGQDHALLAWEALSRSVFAAPNSAARQRTLSVLEPFLERNLFQGGYSPLLLRHTVREGESLALLAKRYETTIDGISRLNGLKQETIQPGQGLFVLAGKVELFIKKSEFRLWALVGGKLLVQATIGLGRNDSTPDGDFLIVERQRDPIWYPQNREPIPAGDPRNILGTRWLGFKDTEKLSGFGIHGTPDESSLGKEISSGCVRMRNQDIERLFDFVPYNTVVHVTN